MIQRRPSKIIIANITIIVNENIPEQQEQHVIDIVVVILVVMKVELVVAIDIEQRNHFMVILVRWNVSLFSFFLLIPQKNKWKIAWFNFNDILFNSRVFLLIESFWGFVPIFFDYFHNLLTHYYWVYVCFFLFWIMNFLIITKTTKDAPDFVLCLQLITFFFIFLFTLI